MKLFENIICKKICIITVLIIFFIFNQCRAIELDKLRIGGAYMGVLNVLTQDKESDQDPKRRQFDMAMNLDFEWLIHPKITGIIQFQSGPGGGSLGFAGPDVAVTDLCVEIAMKPNFLVTLGSFDTPFCLETEYLTNNADGFNNSLLLNSLFYSALAGTNVGSLNTLGIKGEFLTKLGQLSMAITNGTDEGAFNPDGNFEYVISACSKSLISRMHVVGSYIFSKDTTSSGGSGSASVFEGFTAGVRQSITENFYLDGYWGKFRYGDNNPITKDGLQIWKIESKYGFNRWYFAGRISGWIPEKHESVSPAIPNPGLAVFQQNTLPAPGHEIHRYQFTIGWKLSDVLLVKCEGVFDSYRSAVQFEDTNVKGLILSLNSRF